MTADTSRKSILIIDDDSVTVRMLEGVLTANGFEVRSAVEAPQGLESAIQQPADLIILDVMMPIINGFNICRLIKSQESHRHVPIILLTSRADDKDIEIGREVGADAYLTKPLDTDRLLEKIRKLTG